MSQSQLPLTGEETGGAEALIPEHPTLKSLREAAAGCKARCTRTAPRPSSERD